MEAHTSRTGLLSRSKFSAANGDPVEVIVRRVLRSCDSAGVTPAFRRVSMYLAYVPNNVMPNSSTRSNSDVVLGCTGEPSYTTSVACDASAPASQFHIIQPVVVK